MVDLDTLRAKFPGYKIISQPSPDCGCNGGVRHTKTGREVLCICVCLSAPEPGEEDYRIAVRKALGTAAHRQAKAEVTRLYDELGRVSEELGLPRSIGPASGWLKQQMSDLSEARRLLATRVEADRLSEGELRKDIAAVLAQEEEMRTHAVGDWIRFMYQGHLVIDEIAYLVPRASWDSTIQAVTVAHGQVPLDSVLETRPAAVLAQEEK